MIENGSLRYNAFDGLQIYDGSSWIKVEYYNKLKTPDYDTLINFVFDIQEKELDGRASMRGCLESTLFILNNIEAFENIKTKIESELEKI